MRRSGFTVIELLLVIGIIGILAMIVLVAINPVEQLLKDRNAQRRSDLNAVLNAVYQYAGEHSGALPSAIAKATAEKTYEFCVCTRGLCPALSACGTKNDGMINLRALSGAYFAGLPHDPSAAITLPGARYFVVRDRQNHLTVTAPDAEGDETISVTR